MRIKLITPEEHAELLRIQFQHPLLTYDNKGYDYPDKSNWSKEDHNAHAWVSNLLARSVVGFVEFNHFKPPQRRGGRNFRLRFQYNYGAEDYSMPFTGVGYLQVDELLRGFTDQTP